MKGYGKSEINAMTSKHLTQPMASSCISAPHFRRGSNTFDGSLPLKYKDSTQTNGIASFESKSLKYKKIKIKSALKPCKN